MAVVVAVAVEDLTRAFQASKDRGTQERSRGSGWPIAVSWAVVAADGVAGAGYRIRRRLGLVGEGEGVRGLA